MRIRLSAPGHSSVLLAELNHCRLARTYCDVYLQVSNRTFPAHRAVLACSGTYFRNLFSGSTPLTSSPCAASTFSLEFVSPLNFEKVLTFIYTGEILTDLIDVGVLYELAERLGVCELVKACHGTFPDLKTSDCKSGAPGELTVDCVSTVTAAAGACPSACSSAASCSSLSSSRTEHGPHGGASDQGPHGAAPRLDLKIEDVQSHVEYGMMMGGHGPGLSVVKTERDTVDEDETGSGCDGRVVAGGDAAPDPSAQLAVRTAHGTTPSSNTTDGTLRLVGSSLEKDGRPMLPDVEEDRSAERNGSMEACDEDEEQWRALADDIIELSDDDNFLEEEEEEEDDDDDLVCVENGGRTGNSGTQMPEKPLSCKCCSAPLPPDPAAVQKHAESHLTEQGLCRVCGASFSERPTSTAALTHSLTHVGVQLSACDMCSQPFFTRAKLLRHVRQTSCGYRIPPGALTSSGQDPGPGPGPELRCAVCNKTLGKDFQTVKEHALSHVCPQTLCCGVCHLPQLSLCSLLWHSLSHLSLPVFSCPHCARCFSQRPLLDAHVAAHAHEALAVGREPKAFEDGLKSDNVTSEEDLHCFLCPQTFRTSSAFHYHLSSHTTESLGNNNNNNPNSSGLGHGAQGWLGKRKAEHSLDGPPQPPYSSSSSVKMSHQLGLTLGMGYSVPEKFFQGMSSSSGVTANGSGALSGQGNGGGANAGAGVRGKWYRCRFCGKRFAHSGEFTYHLRIHTGEKPYQCKVCLRFFRGRSTMICHLKTHAGALMYRCTACGLFYSTLKMVSSHMEQHKDQLPQDWSIEHTFMYNDHSKEPLTSLDA